MTHSMYIDGELQSTTDIRPVVSPATGKTVGEVAWADACTAERALHAADAAFKNWAGIGPEERATWMRKLCTKVTEHKDALTRAVHLETGKSWGQSEEDSQMLIDALRFYAVNASANQGVELPDQADTHRHTLTREPLGVAVAFVAWNFPLLNIAYKVGPAMAAGCPIIIKPSPRTPLAAYLFGEICAEIGLPAGVVNIICGNDAEVGDTLSKSSIPSLVTLIGSTATALHVMAVGSSSIKRYSMELGGNAPVLVFADADLDRAADVITTMKFANAGQVCVTPNRVLVDSSVADDLKDRLVTRAKAIDIGWDDPHAYDMGPVIDRSAADRIQALVDDARSHGAAILAGGTRLQDTPTDCFFAPTVVDRVTPEMRLFREEVFGPVISVMTFDSENDALRLANDTDAGLSSYIFTSDDDCARRVADALRFGEVQVNGVKYAIDLPHGGIKQSGMGHDCSLLALEDYLGHKRVSRELTPVSPTADRREADTVGPGFLRSPEEPGLRPD